MKSQNNIAAAIRQRMPAKRFELTEKQIKLLKTSAHVVLAVAAVAGLAAVAVMAPNVLQIMGKSRYFKKSTHEQKQKKITKSFYYLKSAGYIDWKQEGKGLALMLTKKGREKLNVLNFQTMQIEHKTRWDGRWWVVLADVPQESRRQEDLLRTKLKEMGFNPFQRSVWIYPHNPRTEVGIVSKFYQIERFVTTMRVDTLETPDKAILLKYFKDKRII